jgi:hypothetical protein
MSAKPGNVLVIAEGEKAAQRLGRWVAAEGQRPVLVHGPDIQIFERGGDSTIDLVRSWTSGSGWGAIPRRSG